MIIRTSLVREDDPKTRDQERRGYRFKRKRSLTEAELLAAEYADLRSRAPGGWG